MTQRKKIHRFITTYRKVGTSLEITDKDIIHQIKDVLKIRNGEECIFTYNDNIEYLCEITETSKTRITAKIIESSTNDLEPVKNVTLYLSILKKENFELVLQKASEMGIRKIVPIITERTVKSNLNYERLYKIAREASELSGRSNVTEIADITDFQNAIINDNNTLKILFDISGNNINKDSLEFKSLSVYIGPEGGFTDNEINLSKENNFKIYNLGKLTMRGETAGIIACYLALQ